MIDSILNGIAPQAFVGFLFWSFIGGVIGMLTEQIKSFKPIKASGGFVPLVWMKANWKRVVISILVMAVTIIFQEDLSGMAATNFTALMAGFGIDTVVDRFVNRKK